MPTYPRLPNFYNTVEQPSAVRDEKNRRLELNSLPATPTWKKFENDFWIEMSKFNEEISHISCDLTTYEWGSRPQESQQIDCLFIRKQIAFYCGATTQNTNIIEKIRKFKKEKNKVSQNNIKQYLNDNFNVDQIIFVFVCHKDLNQEQKDLLKRFKIPFIEKKHLDYIRSIHMAYKSHHRLAFNNFVQDILSSYVKVDAVAGNNVDVPAIRYQYKPLSGGNGYCYNFVIHPDDLLDICSVIHRKSNFDLDKSYQRFVAPHRLNKIKTFTESNKQFANNIILQSDDISINDFSEAKNTAAAQNNKKFNDPDFDYDVGILKLPPFIGKLKIIDGQHRLFGYDFSNKKNTHFVNVTLFDKTLKINDQMKLFMDINDTQESINKNLKWELYENTLESDSWRAKISKFVNIYTRKPEFELYKKMTLGIPLEEDKEKHVKLTVAGFCDELYISIGYNNNQRLFSYLMSIFNDDYDLIFKVLNAYLKSLKNSCQNDWDSNSKGLILNGNFFKALLIIFKEILSHWNLDGSFNEKISNLNELPEHFSDSLEKVTEWINSQTQAQKELFKKENKGGVQKIIAITLANLIKEKQGYENFAIYLRSQGGQNMEFIDHVMNIFNIIGEQEDLEAKEVIWGSNSIHGERYILAERQLKTALAFHNHIGGRIFVGIKERQNPRPGENKFEIVGCDQDIIDNAQNQFEIYQEKIERWIKKMSNGKIIPNVILLRYLQKSVVVIEIKRKDVIQTTDDFLEGHFRYLEPDKNEQPIYGRASNHKTKKMTLRNATAFLNRRNYQLEEVNWKTKRGFNNEVEEQDTEAHLLYLNQFMRFKV